jgi:hypothetical protein
MSLPQDRRKTALLRLRKRARIRLIGRRRTTTTPWLICTPKWPLPREPVAASMWPNQWRTTELPSKLIRTRPCSSRGPTIFQFFGFQPHNQAGYSAKPIPRNSRLAPVSCKTRTIPLRLGPPPTHGVAEAGLARRSEFIGLAGGVLHVDGDFAEEKRRGEGILRAVCASHETTKV